MERGARRRRQDRCCICSRTIAEEPAHLLVYWPDRDEPVALAAHPDCLAQRAPLIARSITGKS
jgi:hypothetical protein